MPNWGEVLKEIEVESSISPVDRVRRKYLAGLSRRTGRNVIAYYSGWLIRDPRIPALAIGDEDMNAFMTTIHGLDRNKGLDLILHTPGGNLAAAESLVSYLRKMFGNDIRAIIPQLAMSAGTMISCACKEIIMGKESSLGPIDPQFNNLSAPAVIDEFNRAVQECQNNPAGIPMWQTIIGKYPPTFLGDCQHAIDWAKTMVKQWLETGMFSENNDKTETIEQIVDLLSDHVFTKSHSRHIGLDDCVNIGLKIIRLEDDKKMQDLVLTVHHAYMHTFSQTSAIKIVENHRGAAVVLRQ